ncbi:MAG: plasmid stability protein [Nevskia sp.]|nr:plasmid stability protein [Nevskia sp.]
MATIIVRNLPDAAHRALKVRAAHHGRSTEAEVRELLIAAVGAPARVGIGSALAAFGQRYGGLDLAAKRDRSKTRVADFE